MNTPTRPRKVIVDLRDRPQQRGGAGERDCLYEGIHSVTGARYSVRMRTIVGEVGGQRPPSLADVLQMLIQSSDPTNP